MKTEEKQKTSVPYAFICKWAEIFGQETGFGYLTPPRRLFIEMLRELGIEVEHEGRHG